MNKDYSAKRCENCIVRQFNDLRALSNEELREVSKSKVSKKIKKGEIIFEEGEKLNGVFCIREGVSKLSKLSSNGKDQIVKLATKGEIIGQRAVISEENVDLCATALNDMEVCFIPKEKIVTPLKSNPDFTMEILKTILDDLKYSNNSILSLTQKSVKQRIAKTLLYIKNNYGEDTEGYLNLNISREDLSSIVGTAVESCIRCVSSLKKEGALEFSGKKMRILNSEKLEKLIDDL
jgi:CRP-like cAMP-binding protein